MIPKKCVCKIRKEADNLYLAMNSNGRILKINESGKQIIEKCDGKNSLLDIALFISEKYSIDIEMAKNEVKAFIECINRAKIQ